VTGMRPLITVLALAACGLLTACSSSSWQPGFGLEECVRRAKLAMRDSDFTERLGVAGDAHVKAISGRHGSYWAQIDCAKEQRTVTVAVTGPDPELTERYKRSVTGKF
jgi:hypothetical protein